MSRRRINKAPKTIKPKGPAQVFPAQILEQKRAQRRAKEVEELKAFFRKKGQGHATLSVKEIADGIGWEENKVKRVIERVNDQARLAFRFQKARAEAKKKNE